MLIKKREKIVKYQLYRWVYDVGSLRSIFKTLMWCSRLFDESTNFNETNSLKPPTTRYHKLIATLLHSNKNMNQKTCWKHFIMTCVNLQRYTRFFKCLCTISLYCIATLYFVIHYRGRQANEYTCMIWTRNLWT